MCRNEKREITGGFYKHVSGMLNINLTLRGGGGYVTFGSLHKLPYSQSRVTASSTTAGLACYGYTIYREVSMIRSIQLRHTNLRTFNYMYTTPSAVCLCGNIGLVIFTISMTRKDLDNLAHTEHDCLTETWGIQVTLGAPAAVDPSLAFSFLLSLFCNLGIFE